MVWSSWLPRVSPVQHSTSRGRPLRRLTWWTTARWQCQTLTRRPLFMESALRPGQSPTDRWARAVGRVTAVSLSPATDGTPEPVFIMPHAPVESRRAGDCLPRRPLVRQLRELLRLGDLVRAPEPPASTGFIGRWGSSSPLIAPAIRLPRQSRSPPSVLRAEPTAPRAPSTARGRTSRPGCPPVAEGSESRP